MGENACFDCLIIGGGPAGLTAGIYLARFNRSVLVIDKAEGRSSYDEYNENYLGFPQGVYAKKLRLLGKKQAKRFGVRFATDEVLAVEKHDELFLAKGDNNTYQGKTVIFATGVIDLFPPFANMRRYIGHSLFWCITCDGYKTRNKRVVIVGHTDESVVTCLQFLIYTDKLSFVLNCGIEQAEISDEMRKRLEQHHIPFIEGVIKKVEGDKRMMKEVILTDGTRIAADYIFNQQGAVPHSIIAKHLGVKTDEHGYILVGQEQRTNIPFVYAAGDVTKRYSHQIVTAAHEGSMAAQAANYDLYEPFQKA
jgi:thioredoxin reductase (NADPH)